MQTKRTSSTPQDSPYVPSSRGPRGRQLPNKQLVAWLLVGVVGAGIGTTRAWDRQSQSERVDVKAHLAIVSDSEMESGWDLPNLDHERVDYWVHRFTTSKRDEFARYLERSGRYVPMIEQKLEERGMPKDLIYLAMIESGFNPTAKSPAKAVGLWQFMEETGENYGLDVNRAVDERRDPELATEAALDYLTYLKNRLGSWYLAAAGYNTGENRVARIMREETGSERGTELDYYRIWDRLPRETRDYVPLMVAAARIAKDPAKYGFENVERESPLEYDEVEVAPATPLKAIAEASAVELDEIQLLNPQLRLERTRNDEPSRIRVPKGSRMAFEANFERVREKHVLALRAQEETRAREAKIAKARTAKAKSSAKTYRVRKGDSLGLIANRHGVSLASLKRTNGIRGSKIMPGQTLRIPRRG